MLELPLSLGQDRVGGEPAGSRLGLPCERCSCEGRCPEERIWSPVSDCPRAVTQSPAHHQLRASPPTARSLLKPHPGSGLRVPLRLLPSAWGRGTAQWGPASKGCPQCRALV